MKDEEGEKTDFLCLRDFVGCKVTFATENLMTSDNMKLEGSFHSQKIAKPVKKS